MEKLKRILVLGDPGSGKNFVGKRLSGKLNISFYDLDDLKFKRKYDIIRPNNVLEKMIVSLANKPAWIISGVTYVGIESVIKRSDLILVLRESFLVESFRILRRWLSRQFARNAPRETLKNIIALIKWDYQEFHKIGGKETAFFNSLKKKYKNKVRILKNKSEIDEFIGLGL